MPCYGHFSSWLKSWWIIAANSSVVFVCLTGFADARCCANLVDGGRTSVFPGGVVRLAASKKLKDCALCDDDAGIGAFVFVGHFAITFSLPHESAQRSCFDEMQAR
jgi:hypothetical protein